MVREHFTPSYNPWDQRLCAVPDADLFKALKKGRAEVVTDRIRTFTPTGVELESGRVLPADIVISATGLNLLAFGGIDPAVDGEPVALDEQFVWNGAMMTGVPNFALCIGYTNASWTLRADLSSRLVCKVLNHMTRHDYAAIVPRPTGPLQERPLLELASGYVQRSIAAFPRQGDHHPWRVRQNYVLDAATTLRTERRGPWSAPPAPNRPDRTRRGSLRRSRRRSAPAAARWRGRGPARSRGRSRPGSPRCRRCPRTTPRRAARRRARSAR